MRKNRPRELVQACAKGVNNCDSPFKNRRTLVLVSVGLSCGAEQGNAEDISVTGKPVLGFREDSNTVPELAQVRKLYPLQLARREATERSYLVTTDLEFGKVPSGIFVSRTLDVSERRLIGCNIAVDIERYLNLVLQSGPRSSRSARIHTYTSRTRVSGANLHVLRS